MEIFNNVWGILVIAVFVLVFIGALVPCKHGRKKPKKKKKRRK